MRLADIHVPERLREVDDDYALAIQASIVEHGQFQPVLVRQSQTANAATLWFAGATPVPRH